MVLESPCKIPTACEIDVEMNREIELGSMGGGVIIKWELFSSLIMPGCNAFFFNSSSVFFETHSAEQFPEGKDRLLF